MKNREALDGDAVTTHATTHAHSFCDTTASTTATADRTDLTLGVLLTMGATTALEAVALHASCEAFTLARTSDDDAITYREGIYIDFTADRIVCRILNAELLENLERLALSVSENRLRNTLDFLFLKGDLDGTVAVLTISSLNLGNGNWARLEDGTSLNLPVLLEDLRHALLAGENEFHGKNKGAVATARDSRTGFRLEVRPEPYIATHAQYRVGPENARIPSMYTKTLPLGQRFEYLMSVQGSQRKL
jgi:hypothetical protein